MTQISEQPNCNGPTSNDDPVEDFRYITMIQKIDTTRSKGIEV